MGENAGGPYTLIYGGPTNHVLGLEIVTPEGEIVQVGGWTQDMPGYDLTEHSPEGVLWGDCDFRTDTYCHCAS